MQSQSQSLFSSITVSETTEEVRQFSETGQRHENEAVKGYQRLGVNGFVLCLSFGVFDLWPLLSAGA